MICAQRSLSSNVKSVGLTVSFSILNGRRKKFITAALVCSGIYLDRNVPKQGKYSPQHISNTKKLVKTGSTAYVHHQSHHITVEIAGMISETNATANKILEIASADISHMVTTRNWYGIRNLEMAIVKIVLPTMIETMKQAKMRPKGSASLCSVIIGSALE